MDRVELASFLDTGVAMLGAAANEHLRPEAFRVWGASVDSGGLLRALVSSDAGMTLAAARDGARMCFTFTDVLTFRSMQAKGRLVGAAKPPGPSDVQHMLRYGRQFTAKLVEVGHPPQLGEQLTPVAVFVVQVDVDELYDQTPGPGAGARLPVA